MNSFDFRFFCCFLSWCSVLLAQAEPTLYQDSLSCPDGWTYLGGDKCYKVFMDNEERTWHRAEDICKSYGSHLAFMKDQEESNKIGHFVNADRTSDYRSFWVGVNCPDPECVTGAYSSYGDMITENQAPGWADGQPDFAIGQCGYTKKNKETYAYDKPYVQAMDHCSVKRSFVCERMAAPRGSFHCFSGGYVDMGNLCNRRRDCPDGSDEMDCPSLCNYYLKQPSGQIALPMDQLGRDYENSQTCTWALEAPIGSNIYINFATIDTEQDADRIQVYVGSIVETVAMATASLSGRLVNQEFRSPNNMMFIKFSSDYSITASGFVAQFSSVSTNMSFEVTRLTAVNTPQTITTPVHEVDGVSSFVAMTDYVYVIYASDPYQIVTVEILNLMLGDDDKIVFYDGESPHSKHLLTVCNDCEDYTVISSTGKYLSVHLSTDKPGPSAFSFRYKQGCDVTLTTSYGKIFTPGYMGNIHYPNNIACTWTINVAEPISLYFDPDLDISDDFTCINRSNDYLQLYQGINNAGTPVHVGNGFGTADLAGRTFQSPTGQFYLMFRSTSTMNARGFKAYWSKDCVNPVYDSYTLINSGSITTAPYHYTATMTLTCALGYGFHQQQITLTSVTFTCNYKGEWNFRQIPRCTPNYCGVAPSIVNGYIAYSTGSVYESIASYECYPGSSLRAQVGQIDNNNITCLASGNWQLPPVCDTATCNINLITLNPPNGLGVIRAGTGNGNSIGSIVDYDCNDGYEIDGDPILICKDNGQWSSNNPTCRKKTCLLPSIPHGTVNPSTGFIEFNDVASVQCDVGYTFNDPLVTSMTCLGDRSVDQIPECVDEDECDRLVCQSLCYNNIGSYECGCDAGYDLLPNGFNCQDRDECLLGEHACDQQCSNTQGGYTCSCTLPYVLFSEDGIEGHFKPSSETGLLMTDTLRYNQSCVLISCPNPENTFNLDDAQLFPIRPYHHYGDYIEIRCNLGYTDIPKSSTLFCSQNGVWVGTAPTCAPATCPDLGGLQLYTYLEQVDTNCTVAGRFFQKRRDCVYNRASDQYELQGSSPDCGNVDCGTPEQMPGSNYFAFSTTYGSTFEFTCGAGNNPTGSSSETVIDRTVTCEADGYWTFGNLQCFSQSCEDPGYPAGGIMIASGFADRQIVTFECTKPGYTLTHTDALMCLGTSFNGTVPDCVDTTPPSISLRNGQPCDGTYTITVKKYDSIPLPIVDYSDNDGILSYVIEPPDANGTLKVDTSMIVTFRVTDYAGLQSTCQIGINLADETPPIITCPPQSALTVYIDDENDVQTLDIDSTFFTVTDNAGSQFLQPVTIINKPKTTFGFADLYQTFSFRATVQDQSNNAASCEAQVFVTTRSCTPNSFPTPLNAQKVCTPTTFPLQGYRCEITCDPAYHFEADGGPGKTRVVSCNTGGAWNTAFISACVRDNTYPILTCPISQTIEFTNENDQRFVDFSTLGYSVTDLNIIASPVFSLESYTFTSADLEQTREVVLTVTDAAGFQSSCRFQYLVLARTCSPLSYPDTLFATKTCSRNFANNGYTCTITADPGYVLRDHGISTVVDCIDGSTWDEIIPAAVIDTIDPTVSCPSSKHLYLSDTNDFIEVEFGVNDFTDFQQSDAGGISASTFLPAAYNFTRNDLYQTRTISYTVRDNNNNAASCSFSVHLLPAVCSPLSLPTPQNGQKVCTRGFNGWSCELSCNANYGFTLTAGATTTLSCTDNVAWNNHVPGCASLTQTTQTVYFGQYEYKYQPDVSQINISESCREHYLERQNRLSPVVLANGSSIQKPLYEAMAERMKDGCFRFANVPLESGIDIKFIPELFTLTISDLGSAGFPLYRLVTIYYTFTMTALDANQLNICKDWLLSTLVRVPNGYEFAALGIPGDGADCPNLVWDQRMNLTSEGYQCLDNYFISPLDSNVCRPCPWGSISNSVTCNLCGIGTYHASPNSLTCTSCGGGRTTRYPGATSSGECVSQCLAGQFSVDGFAPCSSCPIGTYSLDTQTCVSCGPGKTTSAPGSSSAASCFDIVVQREPCGAGTETSGNNCVLCPEGQYSTVQDFQCRPCILQGTTTYIQGAVSNSSCHGMCGNGLTSLDGRPPCFACPIGTFYVNSTYCESCPVGQTTRFVGSTRSADCILETILRVKCPVGTYRDGTSCTRCAEGYFSNQEESSSCTQCPIGSSTYYEGATSSIMCFSLCAGGTTSSTGLSPCSPCGLGFYSLNPTTCQPCPAGSTTKTTTAASESQCIPECSAGRFSDSGYNFDGLCRACPANFYQDRTGSTTCSQCLNTQYTSPGQIGLTSSTACLTTAQQDLCPIGRCSNGGNCLIQDHDFYCDCASGWYGRTCNIQVNFCENNPCFNGGICSNTDQGPSCNCRGFATGDRCEVVSETCTPDYCQNGGHCRNFPGRRECLCTEKFSGTTCSIESPICVPNPCQNNGVCVDTSFGENLRRKCSCQDGWEGINCEIMTNFCESTPCLYGGTCVPILNDYRCNCPTGYSGKYCQSRQDRCASVNCGSGRCVDDYTLDEPRCICSTGFYYGSVSQYSIRLDYAATPLPNSPSLTGTVEECRDTCDRNLNCVSFTYYSATSACYINFIGSSLTVTQTTGYNYYEKDYMAETSDDFWSPWFDISSPANSNGMDDIELRADINNVYGLNVCEGTVPISVECRNMRTGTLDTGARCTTDGYRCDGFTNCDDYEVRYKCAVHRVFKQNTCEFRNYCISNPCVAGTCTNGIGTYRCNCPAGRVGQNCQTDIDECAGFPCQHGGRCVDQLNGFSCDCTPATGYTGVLCDLRINFCQGVDCGRRGTCENLLTGYRCVCSQGYTGANCESETDLCVSNPCLHGGVCQPRFNSYFCDCPAGWTGRNCDEIVDSCAVGGRFSCQAECYSIFQDYYCKCPANTYGRDCDTTTNPCLNYNKCQNGAPCNYDLVNGMTCGCDMRYTGDGCHILVDHCSATTNNCQNGATCYLTPAGYGCSCAPGYTGANCEREINECAGVACPGGGTCFDDIGRYYCRCPLGKTGSNCQYEKQTDYDICFSHPEGLNHARIPFPNLADNADNMAVTLWVRYSVPGTGGVYFTMYIGDRFRESFKFMEFFEDGVKVFISTDNNVTPYTILPFTYDFILNNGNWHSIVVNYDLANGRMTLYADSIKQTTKAYNVESPALIIQDRTFRFWVALGCEFNQVTERCMLGNRFHGCVSQVNFYKRLLDFNDEIPILIQNPPQVFSPRFDVLLLWNEYLLEGSDRVIPSEADLAPCPGRCTTYTVRSRPTLSVSRPCPSDQIVYSTDRLTSVAWTEPVFEDAISIERPLFQSGASYHWGTFQVTYIAVGASNEKTMCSFKLYVQSSSCDNLPNPLGGTQSCDVDPAGYKGCTFSCTNSITRSYLTDRIVPKRFTCDPTGSWNVAKRFNRFLLPPCGELFTQPPRVSLYMRVVYQIGTRACEAAEINFLGRVLEKFVFLNDQMNNELCATAACLDLMIKITCGNFSGINDDTVSVLEVTVPDAIQRTTIGVETMLTQDFITCSVLGPADILNFASTIPYGDIERATYFITPTLICPSGHVLIDDKCVQCGAGTYYSLAGHDYAICEDCPIGYYQSSSGQDSCIYCGDDLTTEMTGSNDFTQCKQSCSQGQYFSNLNNRCMPCPLGFFQDEEGQFYCKFCERGQTTSNEGSISRAQCQETCPSGQQLVEATGCELCGIGFYRNETETRLCVQCPSGTITVDTGSISRSACTVAACEAGRFLDVNTNTCQQCPIGTYQDKIWQNNCTSCGDAENWRTDQTGSADPTDCKFYCPSGYEAKDLGTLNPYCSPCAIGYYKNNNFNIYGQCQECVGNYRTEFIASISDVNCTIYRCPAGQRPNAGHTDCEMCPLGTYQPDADSTACIGCTAGTWTRLVGSIEASACETYCDDGAEKQASGRCVDCLQGYYKDNDLGRFSDCTACPVNYTTLGPGSEEMAACSIRACPAGTRRNALETACIDCEQGYYSSLPYQPRCEECPTGQSTRDTASTSINQCEFFCSAGREKNLVTGSCDICPRGYYKDNTIDVFSYCTLCPIDKITAGTGAENMAACNIGNCTEGYRLDVNNDCEICPKGKYQDQWWQTVCIDCGVDKTTENPGAGREDLCILECPPGKQDIGGLCQECPRGYFKTQYLAAACTPCPTGTTTETTGADDPALCSLPACEVGYYLDRSGAVMDCKKCGYDTFQDEIWMESCKPCTAGLVTLMTGATLPSDCVRNCSSGSQYNMATKVCDICPIGYYRDQFDRMQAYCQLCDVNFITDDVGATSINQCNIRNCTVPGEFRNPLSNQCEPCQRGTYLNQKWQIRCLDCPADYSTLTTGSTSIDDCRPTCPAGQFVGSNNVCQNCPIGSYRTGLAGENCEPCPDGLLTPQFGAKSDSECSVTPCFKGQYYIRNSQQCQPCQRGTYQDQSGKFQCLDCPYEIKYTPTEGADSLTLCNSICLRGQQYDVGLDQCVACPVGTYQDENNRFTCTQCPSDKPYTASPGSTSFSSCINRCDAGNDCHSNALCISSATSYTCQCFTNHRDINGDGRLCLACQAGTYYDNNVCRTCPDGQYQPNEAQSSCLTCGAGTEPNTGRTACTQCVPGTYSSSATTRCVRCPAGQYQPNYNQSACLRCVDSDSNQDRTACINLCDLDYCKNGATCNVGPPVSCQCGDWYTGDTCDVRLDGKIVADKPLDIAIPVSIAVGAFLLILIIIAVACFVCWKRSPTPRSAQYTEFQGDRVDKVSVHSYGQSPYNFTSQKLMLAPATEIVYDNQAYTGSAVGDPAVFVA